MKELSRPTHVIYYIHRMKHSLENHKAFPTIAWVTFIGFVVFVFYLTIELQSTSTNLSERTTQNIEALENTP